jgi:hypothetical protein
MLVMDMFVMPQQEAPVIVNLAQADSAKSPSEPLYGAVGVCTISPTFERLKQGADHPSFLDGMSLYPEAAAGQLFPEAKYNADLQADIEAAKVEVIQQPLHGTITAIGGDKYMPNEEYRGKDKVVFLVNIAGHIVRVEEFINVIDADIFSGDFTETYKEYCPQEQWPLSSGATESGAMAMGILHKEFSLEPNDLNVTFGNLPGSPRRSG